MSNQPSGASAAPSPFDPSSWLARWHALGHSAELAGTRLYLGQADPPADRSATDALLDELRAADGSEAVRRAL